MAASLATLNGLVVTTCRVQIPAWGLWWAEVECASQDVLSGRATLVLDDVTFVGTIVTGGAYETRTRYRIVGGAGGWGREVAPTSYVNDAGVKLAIVLRDAAVACGETIGTVGSDAVGPAFVRHRGPGSRVLETLVPRGWYVDEAGVTQVGRRPAVAWTGAATRITNDEAQRRYELAPSTLVGLLPGAIVDGVEALDVEHVLDGEGKLRTTLWGGPQATSARLPEALRRIVETFTERHRYFAPWEYRVVLPSGERLDLQATRVSSGMPDLRAVRVRPSAGCRAHVALGSLVLVSFANGDPSRPVVTSTDEADAPGFVPGDLYLQAGTTGTDAGAVEHATSAEALLGVLQVVLASIGAALTAGGAGSAAAGTTITTLATTGFAAYVPALAAGALDAGTKTALLAALSAKTADTTGQTPSLGWPAVRGG